MWTGEQLASVSAGIILQPQRTSWWGKTDTQMRTGPKEIEEQSESFNHIPPEAHQLWAFC